MTGYTLPNSPIIMGMKDASVTKWLLDLSFEITAMYVPELPVDLSSSCCSGKKKKEKEKKRKRKNQ